MSKACSVCLQIKDFSAFYRATKSKTGFGNRCKECERHYQTSRKDAKAESNKRWYANNRHKYLEIKRAKTRACKIFRTETVLAQLAAADKQAENRWRKQRASRLLQKTKATPVWVDEKHRHRIMEIYALTQQLQEITGTVYHVDHIVPLFSDTVCGLHVWWNLQPIPEKSNVLKRDAFEPRLYPEQGVVAFPSGGGPTTVRNTVLKEDEDDERSATASGYPNAGANSANRSAKRRNTY